MPADPAKVRAASRTAQEGVATAISAIVELGPDAPASLREALSLLGSAFSSLGWSDPQTPYSVPSEEGDDRG